MANFPFYHGITLAQGAYVENLVVERVAADPVPAEAGRIWFNTTDKKFRQSTLDAGGAVVVRSFATEEDLVASIQAALAAEVTARTAADATLQANIDAEATARAAADTTLSNNLASEVTARTATDATLQANIDAEATARAAADTTLSNNLASEVTARTATDATLQANIDAEVTARQTAITIEASARVAGDATLQANLDAEATARAAADTTLQSNLDAEATARAAADATLTTNLAAEVTRATAAEATLQSALDAEVTARAAADATLQAAINALGSAFNYVGTLVGGDVATPLDLAALAQKDAGDYYKVTTAGYFVVGAGTAFYANVGDGLVWNLSGGIDKIDNTDSNVAGTTNFIEVTGSADTGFVVDVAAAFKTRVSDLETAGAAEATARAAADATLQANIDAEATARAAADTTLQANIDAEATARVAGDAAVKTAYNATIWTYESPTAATTHVLAHNLNNAFVDFSIMIQRADGSWYNDIASIVVDTANQATLYLTTALKVRVIARSAAQLA